MEPSDTLAIRNIRFYRGEDDRQAAARSRLPAAATPSGRASTSSASSTATANAIDVSYDVAVLAPSGKVLYTQPQAGADRSQSFYPKRYVPAVISLATKPDTRPGEYTVVITAHDGVGNQTYEARQSFTIE